MISEPKIVDFREFAERYTDYKEQKLIPKEIAGIMQSEYDCGETCYYNALRFCRKRGLITDSYAETKAAAIARQKEAARLRRNTIQSEGDCVDDCSDIDSSEHLLSNVPCKEHTDTKSHKLSNQLLIIMSLILRRLKLTK